MKLLFILIAGLNVAYFYLGGVLQKVEALGPSADPPLVAKLVSLTQGTAALKSLAVPSATLERLLDKTTMELLCGSARRLWG